MKKRVFVFSNNRVSVTTFIFKSKNKNEIDKEFMDRISSQFSYWNDPNVKYYDLEDSSENFPSDLKDERCRLREKPGKPGEFEVWIDPSMPSPIRDAKAKKVSDKASAKVKLKNLGLTDDEIEALTNG